MTEHVAIDEAAQIAATNATLIAEARNTRGYSEGDLSSLVRSLVDALERSESRLATVRRSADAWWSAYNEEVKRSETVRADQIRRDADLIESWARETKSGYGFSTADRLRAQGGGEG